MILKFFDIFLKMKDLTSSEAFLVGLVFIIHLSFVLPELQISWNFNDKLEVTSVHYPFKVNECIFRGSNSVVYIFPLPPE